MTHLQLISTCSGVPGCLTSSCFSPGDVDVPLLGTCVHVYMCTSLSVSPGDVPLLGTEGGEEEQEAEVEHLGGECVESPGEQ